MFPHECQVVLDVIRQVFDHDEQARKDQLSPEARLAYHQAQSQPLMDELKGWLDKQIDDHLVEPNSALGKAIGYMRTHWETLTRFLSIPGAPMDNNLAERVLKLFIRQRKNSLFYKNPHSAYIASVLTSLIATCLYAGVNAVEYLVALQEHRREVFSDPAAWLPWAYARKPGLALGHPSPILGHLGALGVAIPGQNNAALERTGAPVRRRWWATTKSAPLRVASYRANSPGRRRARV